jgi:hypothetical protein
VTTTSTSDWFQTASGKRAWITDPERSEVCIEDIAVSLSRQCRFAGHLRADVPHYSVAQHSVCVSYVCAPEHALIGLLHDASEAYLQDIIRPLKQVLAPLYKPLEDAWSARIGREFGLGDALVKLPPDVKEADMRMLMTERRDLLVEPAEPWTHRAAPLEWPPVQALDAARARDGFLRRFHRLFDEAAR